MADLDETDEHQFAEIIASLKRKSDIDLESFRGTLERLAWFYLEADKLGTKIARPFERRPQLKRLRGKLGRLKSLGRGA